MKKNVIISLVAAALLLTGLFVNACTSNTGMEGSHQMGSSSDEQREDAGGFAHARA